MTLADPTSLYHPILDEPDDEWGPGTPQEENPMRLIGNQASPKSGRNRVKRDFTSKDLDVLEFILHTGWTNIKQCALAIEGNEGTLKQKQARMKARIYGLRALGAIGARPISGGGLILTVLTPGLDALDLTGRVSAAEESLKKGSKISLRDIAHNLGISQVAAGLINGSTAPLGRSYGKASLYDLVYDHDMQSAYKSWETRFNREHADYLDRFNGSDRVVRRQDLIMKHAPKCSFVVVARTPAADGKPLDKLTHRPDLVWKNATRAGEEGLTIAIEVEFSMKEVSKYAETIALFKQNPDRYDHIYWVAQSGPIAKRITAVAASLDYADKVSVVRLKGCDGEPFTKSPWLL